MRTLLEYSLLTIMGVLIIGSLAGAIVERPVFMSYAYSGSMTPTISRGDVFFINPLDRNPGVGDIVVFRTGNGWTVHRVVAITSEGYITKGDNNVATDQQGRGLAPVERNRIAGTVVRIGNRVPKIPRLGNYLGDGVSNGWKIALGTAFVIAGILSLGGGRKRGRRKNGYLVIGFGTLFALVSAILVIMVAISIFASWEVVPINYSVTSAIGSRDNWYKPGEEFQRELVVENHNPYPMVYYLSARSPVTEISREKFSLPGGGRENLTVTIVAPRTTAVYSTKVRINAYPPLLPGPVMDRLYPVHPMVPVLGILVVFSALLGLIYLLSGIGSEEAMRIRRRRNFLGVFRR